MADQIFNVRSGFYDAINADRVYSADDMNRPYKRVVSNGVFATPKGTPSTDLQVVAAGTGMQIIVKSGEGIFADKWFENASDININVPSNTTTLPRIDSVIVQMDKRTSGRVGNIVYRTGTPASSPKAPSVNTVTNVIEYRLANIRVNAGISLITGGMITDRRGSSDCPWVTSLIYQVDTSTLYDQWAEAYASYFETEKAMWDDWYTHLTEELDVSMTLIKLTNAVVTVSETSEVLIGIPEYNPNTDMLEVYINGLRAVEQYQYTVNGSTSISLTSPIETGQTVNFVVLKSVIMGNEYNIMSLINALDAKIAGVSGGTPTVVDSVSDMTDTNKIYILSTDDNWYYYSLTSSEWTVGGEYGGVTTDTTLTQSGSAADAKTVGDIVASINKNIETRMTLATSRRTIIPDGTDINTLVVGNYKVTKVSNANTMINLPTKRPCILFVMSMGTADSLFQICLSSSPDKPNIFYRQKNSQYDEYTEWIKLYDKERDDELKSIDCGNLLPATQLPVYRVVKTLVPASEWIDNVEYDGRTYNQTQGMCSDGKRYLYYTLRTGSVAYGDSNIMLIRKWDTYYNKAAGLHISSMPYGHGEDIEYIPAWVKGFDNGNVNRLYITDMERYATGLTIHVVNADTLEYITSFQTAELPPYGLTEYWRGANHVMFNAQRGEIVLNSIYTDNGTYRCILAVYDKDGNYLRGVLFTRTTGTQLGCMCDENYIYMTRYVTLDGISHQYIYMLDWNLNPVRRVEIEHTHWEWEGICTIGQDIYTSWIVDGTSKGVAIIKNNVLIKDYPYSMTFPDDTWLSTDGFRLNSFTPIPSEDNLQNT